MIIIPELDTVVITPPRTASTSLHKAVKAHYPSAFSLYRHMEANGVPPGYDLWRKIGVVREPLERLWSLYKYIHKGESNYRQQIEKTKGNFELPEFNKWVINENIPLVTGFDYRERNLPTYMPYYSCLVTLPETRKSQYYYLRPDLGTEIIRFDQLNKLEDALFLSIPRANGTDNNEPPEISKEVEEHLKTFFSWDLKQFI